MLNHAAVLMDDDGGGPVQAVMRGRYIGELGFAAFAGGLDPMRQQGAVAEGDHFGQFGGLAEELAVRGDGARLRPLPPWRTAYLSV